MGRGLRMFALHNIESVAKYESKLLMRSWFYRIFLLLVIIALCAYNFLALISEESGGFWFMKALPANIPYINLMFLNTGQAIIAVFLSSEFLKSDKKLDTSEVFYVHPLSNAEYVIGKIWGNARVFIRLDLFVMLLVVVFNIMSGVSIDWLAYIAYFLLICIPTLIYILGLSVGLMLLLKNQAITFVLLLGYIALTLFYVGDKFYYLFDYMVYNLPLVKSSIVGFSNWVLLVNHRMIYLLLGLGFISLSIFLFRRLPNTKWGKYRWLFLSLLFISAGIWASYKHVSSIVGDANMRQLYTEVNNRYASNPRMVIDQYDIDLQQHPNSVTSKVEMSAVAMESASVFTFCLNPGLKVTEVAENDKELPFTRDQQILLIDFGRQVEQGDSVLFTLNYEGVIDEAFCYLDIPPELLQEEFASGMFKIDKKYSFQEEDYLLFTPETYWYPRPGTSYSSENPDWQQAYFSHFRLKVTTINDLIALSQGTLKWPIENGAITDQGDNLFVYETDFLTPSITLIIGDYEQNSIEVDETLFSVWNLKGHNYFSPVFSPIADTIPAQIRERRRSIETSYSLDYSFNRFSLIEVPVQFYSYVRTWTQAREVMQPEMVLFPEMGSLLSEADVVKGARDEKNRAQRNGQEISDEDAAMRVLNRFTRVFERAETSLDWSRDRGSMNVSRRSNPFFLFPQLYNFRYNVFSSEWPVSNRLIELYLQDRADDNSWMRQMNGISNNEKANLLMEQFSFKELLSSVEHRDLLDNVTSLKANNLFSYAEQKVGYKEYRDSLRAVLQRNVFSNIRFESLLDTMGMIADVNLHPLLESWNHPTDLPAYVLGAPEVVHIANRDGEAFVVKQLITNDSDHDGVINVEINFAGGQGAIYDPRAKRKVTFKAREIKNLVSVWDEAPRSISINTLISGNLPSAVTLPVNNIIRERNKPIDEEGDFILESVTYNVPGEVIVDNEDSTLFFLSAPDVVGLLPQWLDQVDDNSFRYSGVSNWRPPLQWTLTTNDKYHGTRIRSAYVIKSGSGSQYATWKIPVPNEGQYDLYYFVFKPEELRRGRGRGRRGSPGGESEYQFKVRYSGDEENAYIDLRRSEEGWSLLGTYFFSDDTVEVVLSDNTKLRTVTADAVKIVRR